MINKSLIRKAEGTPKFVWYVFDRRVLRLKLFNIHFFVVTVILLSTFFLGTELAIVLF